MVINKIILRIITAATGFILLAGTGCSGDFEKSMSGTDSTIVITQVKTATWKFYAADTSRDAEAVLSLLWPEYTMLADGTRLTYEQITQGSREFMSKLKLFHSEWNELHIIPIGHNSAVASFHFRDSIIYKNGEVQLTQGTTSFIWQHRGNEWRVLYADANHRPIEP